MIIYKRLLSVNNKYLGFNPKKKKTNERRIQKKTAQSSETVEYTDCISAEAYDSPNERPAYDTKPSQPCRLGL